MKHVAPKQRRKSVVWTILGILAELMLTAAAASCFEWLFPWAATNIPALQEMSNYTAI